MSIKYKLIQKAQPGVVGGGARKWHAQIVYNEEMTIDHLVGAIEKFSALSEADIKGVIVALENVMQDALADGKIVRLEKLGSFFPSLSSNGVANDADFNAATDIRAVKVNYRPGTRISNKISTATFHRS
jgi:predicted histone-like DNA-binding protein